MIQTNFLPEPPAIYYYHSSKWDFFLMSEFNSCSPLTRKSLQQDLWIQTNINSTSIPPTNNRTCWLLAKAIVTENNF